MVCCWFTEVTLYMTWGGVAVPHNWLSCPEHSVGRLVNAPVVRTFRLVRAIQAAWNNHIMRTAYLTYYKLFNHEAIHQQPSISRGKQLSAYIDCEEHTPNNYE